MAPRYSRDADKIQVPYARFAPLAGLLLVLFVEILYLTISFDTQNLDRVPASWARLIGWSPQYLRVAITTMVVAILVSGRQMWTGVLEGDPEAERFRPYYLTAHLGALALFAWVTATLTGRHFSSSPNQGSWALAWGVAGGTTIISWGLAVLPLQTWLVVLRRGRAGLCWGIGAGVAAWAGGFLTQEFWRPLARHTFSVVAWILRWIYVDTVSDPARLLIGTPSFIVDIAPACSGYEGIGLILAFLSIYVWLSRKHLRFPHALILLPVGAAAIWLLNAVRIAALIVIGTSGWPDVALGGFHSQAGWLSFNAVGLGLVAVSIRGRYFMAMRPPSVPVVDRANPTSAYLAPFLAIVATSMLTGAFSAGFDWFYPARVIAAAAALWTFREHYADLSWKWSWRAIAIGGIAFVIWLALMPAVVDDKDGWPTALGDIPSSWAVLWLVIRVAGYVVTVPLAEELAFRGFLPRRLLQADFHHLPMATWSWLPFLISSLLFGALHGQFWLAGTIAGILFAVALHRGNSLGDAVQAHATTNGLMVLYVFATGHWSAWS